MLSTCVRYGRSILPYCSFDPATGAVYFQCFHFSLCVNSSHTGRWGDIVSPALGALGIFFHCSFLVVRSLARALSSSSCAEQAQTKTLRRPCRFPEVSTQLSSAVLYPPKSGHFGSPSFPHSFYSTQQDSALALFGFCLFSYVIITYFV